MLKSHTLLFLLVLSVLTTAISGCKKADAVVFEEFQSTNNSDWDWKDAKTFNFEINDTTCYYSILASLRISGKYSYSNIWIIYQLQGNNYKEKKQFQIELADQTGRWIGEGMSNLISYEQHIIPKLKLRPGKYSIAFSQNMRDQHLVGVNDIGLRILKGKQIL